jgi:hypothetical protein
LEQGENASARKGREKDEVCSSAGDEGDRLTVFGFFFFSRAV